MDWVRAGYVTPVKDQGQCGSCWTFSATGALEGAHFKVNGNLVTLSEQYLLDCSGEGTCTGGVEFKAFSYIKDAGGIVTEKSYQYEYVVILLP